MHLEKKEKVKILNWFATFSENFKPDNKSNRKISSVLIGYFNI